MVEIFIEAPLELRIIIGSALVCGVRGSCTVSIEPSRKEKNDIKKI